MSYTIDLSDIDREGEESITAQIAERIRSTIDSGALAPGDKLPSTRAMAEQAGVNHLTAVRVYRRLAEEGYVTAGLRRGTFVRPGAPPAAAGDKRGWAAAGLSRPPPRHGNQGVARAEEPPRGPPTG